MNSSVRSTSTIIPTLKHLDKERLLLNDQIRQYQILLFVCIATIGLLGYGYANQWFASYPFGMVVGFIVAVAFALIYAAVKWGGLYNKFVRDIKSKAVNALFKHWEMDWEYKPKTYLHKEKYRATHLFQKRMSSYSGNNYISGTHKGVAFEMSNLQVYKSNGKSRTTIFEGILIILNRSGEVFGTTVVLPDAAESFFGKSIGTTLQSWNSHRGLSMVYFEEDKAFEKNWVVYSNDEQEARTILEAQQRANLNELHLLFPNRCRVAFKPDAVAYSISNIQLFKLSSKHELNRKETIRGVLNDIEAVERMLDFFV